jgi:hypothetical protein
MSRYRCLPCHSLCLWIFQAPYMVESHNEWSIYPVDGNSILNTCDMNLEHKAITNYLTIEAKLWAWLIPKTTTGHSLSYFHTPPALTSCFSKIPLNAEFPCPSWSSKLAFFQEVFLTNILWRFCLSLHNFTTLTILGELYELQSFSLCNIQISPFIYSSVSSSVLLSNTCNLSSFLKEGHRLMYLTYLMFCTLDRILTVSEPSDSYYFWVSKTGNYIWWYHRSIIPELSLSQSHFNLGKKKLTKCIYWTYKGTSSIQTLWGGSNFAEWQWTFPWLPGQNITCQHSAVFYTNIFYNFFTMSW